MLRKMLTQMSKVVFVAFLIATLVVNVIFLVGTTKDKPPDIAAVAMQQQQRPAIAGSVVGDQRRLFARRNSNPPSFDDGTAGNEAAGSVVGGRRSAATTSSMNSAWRRSTVSSSPAAEAYDRHHQTQSLLPKQDNNSNSNSNNNSKHRNKKTLLSVKVKSSKSHVLVIANGATIYESGSLQHDDDNRLFEPATTRHSTRQASAATKLLLEQEQQRGLHVLVLSQFDGSLLAKRVFDTYLPLQDDELNLFLRLIRDGRILLVAVQDEASFQMARLSPARKLLATFGSAHIMQLGWRDMWAFATRKSLAGVARVSSSSSPSSLSSLVLAEALGKAPDVSSWSPPVYIEFDVELDAGGRLFDCEWQTGNADEDARRLEFCTRTDGYGAVCDCDAPAQVSFKSRPINQSALSNVPIVVMASNRPHYLYRMLRSLLSADGVDPNNVVVFVDGFYDEPAAVTKLFKLRTVRQTPLGVRNARISHHYKTSLSAAFKMFAKATHLIIFEEDLDIARDALLYFNATISLLNKDPSLYCVSAWNDQGYEHSARDPRLLYRVESMPGLGWLLARQLYKNELEHRWPSPDNAHDWDMWIRTEAVRKGRECIVPDVSRTYHFGAAGINMNAYFQRKYFAKHAFNVDYNINRDDRAAGENNYELASLANMTKDAYEDMIVALIRQAHVVTQRDVNAPTTASNAATGTLNNKDGFHVNKTSINFADYICSLASASLENYDDDDDDDTTSIENNNDDYNHDQNVGDNEMHKSVSSKHRDSRSRSRRARQNSRRSWDKLAAKKQGRKTIFSRSSSNVIFIDMIDNRDYATWLNLAKCWHIWDLDARGQHNSMWRLFLNGKHTLVVGVPASPYSWLMPKNLLPFKFE